VSEPGPEYNYPRTLAELLERLSVKKKTQPPAADDKQNDRSAEKDKRPVKDDAP
jgi:hypothetical protein